MNPKHKQVIKQRYSEAMALKLDTEQFEVLRAIRRRAIELGYTHDQVTEVFREVRNDNSTERTEQPSVAVSEEVLPPAQEKQTASVSEKELSRRVEASYSTHSGMNPSGGKARQSKVSILDLADKKQTRRC